MIPTTLPLLWGVGYPRTETCRTPEVVVAGCGVAGASAAMHLAERGAKATWSGGVVSYSCVYVRVSCVFNLSA